MLIAIYTEYQKDIPDMKGNITAKSLGFETDVFKMAIEKLENEKLITGASFARGGNGRIPLMVFTDNIMMTRNGIDYVEEKLQIEKTLTGAEKVKEIVAKGASWGWQEFKDFSSKVLGEIIKG